MCREIWNRRQDPPNCHFPTYGPAWKGPLCHVVLLGSVTLHLLEGWPSRFQFPFMVHLSLPGRPAGEGNMWVFRICCVCSCVWNFGKMSLGSSCCKPWLRPQPNLCNFCSNTPLLKTNHISRSNWVGFFAWAAVIIVMSLFKTNPIAKLWGLVLKRLSAIQYTFCQQGEGQTFAPWVCSLKVLIEYRFVCLFVL